MRYLIKQFRKDVKHLKTYFQLLSIDSNACKFFCEEYVLYFLNTPHSKTRIQFSWKTHKQLKQSI